MRTHLEIKNYKPLGEIVFDHLRGAILSGELKPGERLMEESIAEMLGVSRTPVREAIRKLEKESFVIMIPRKGAYVADLTKNDILEVLELRRELEGFASSLAAVRMTLEQQVALERIMSEFSASLKHKDKRRMMSMDDAFHEEIFKAAQNRRLIEIITDLHDQFQRFRLVYFNEFDNFSDIECSHQRIFNAICAKDSALARLEAERHVESIRDHVTEFIQDGNEGPAAAEQTPAAQDA